MHYAKRESSAFFSCLTGQKTILVHQSFLTVAYGQNVAYGRSPSSRGTESNPVWGSRCPSARGWRSNPKAAQRSGTLSLHLRLQILCLSVMMHYAKRESSAFFSCLTGQKTILVHQSFLT